ncbi:MAG: RadC family protein [Candidatus Gracilibacteria bacterium]
MKQLPLSSRPREKFKNVGTAGLSMQELLCILIGSGTKGYPVDRIAKEIEQSIDMNKRCIMFEKVRKIKGLGPSKRMMIEAVLEIGKRLFAPVDFNIQIIRTTEDVLPFLKEYALLRQEHLICLYLNARHELLEKRVVTKGTLTMSLIHPREVFAPALSLGAVSIIIAHNHPSGSLEPSHADKTVTGVLSDAGKLLGIELLDHIIVSKEGWKSILFN